MGAFSVLVDIDDDADLSRVARLRGLVDRRALSREIAKSGDAGFIELTGGAGWGKTSAALQYAASRQREGAHVRFLNETSVAFTGAHVGPELYIVDARSVRSKVVDSLFAALHSARETQLIVSSRGGHEIIDRAEREGLITRRVDVASFPLGARELQLMAAERGVRLSAATVDYAAPALAGWPIVASRFIRRFASRPSSHSLSGLDSLVAQSFEEVLTELIGSKSLPLLVRTSLGSSISPATANGVRDEAIADLIACIRELGLGEWRAA